MTLDVMIGRIQKRYWWSQEKTVAMCPPLDYDLCNSGGLFDDHPEGSTAWPRESYRSGSSCFRDFFMRRPLQGFYLSIYIHERDIHVLAPYGEMIRSLQKGMFPRQDWDRLKWLQFWTKRAIELYGDKAGISFS